MFNVPGESESRNARPMHTLSDSELLSALAADQYAEEMDASLLYLDELDPDICPPDTIYDLGDREAWVYEHGNIAELVFVRVG